MAGVAMLEVIRAGALTTVQDLGRPGHAHLGVPRSGALDRVALVEANRLVGNPEGAAGLETTVTGAAIRATAPVVVAVSGAEAPVTVDGQPALTSTAIELAAGAVLDVGPARSGLRSYIAVAGGIDVETVLGSRSTDLLSGLGPPVLRDGDVLPLGNRQPATMVRTLLDRSAALGRVGADAGGHARTPGRLVHARRGRHAARGRVPGVERVQPDRPAAGGTAARTGEPR